MHIAATYHAEAVNIQLVKPVSIKVLVTLNLQYQYCPINVLDLSTVTILIHTKNVFGMKLCRTKGLIPKLLEDRETILP